MSVTSTLSKAESVVGRLSRRDKSKLYLWLEKELGNGSQNIRKDLAVMGGAACIRDSRIPVWILVQAKNNGISEADLLRNYPTLTAADLTNAWSYWEANRKEIQNAIAANESEE